VSFYGQKLYFFFLAFCHSLYNDIIQRRPNYHQDEKDIELKPVVTKNVSSKTNNPNLNKSLSRKTNVSEQESVSSITDENNSINMKDLSIKRTKSPSSSVGKSILNIKVCHFLFFP